MFDDLKVCSPSVSYRRHTFSLALHLSPSVRRHIRFTLQEYIRFTLNLALHSSPSGHLEYTRGLHYNNKLDLILNLALHQVPAGRHGYKLDLLLI